MPLPTRPSISQPLRTWWENRVLFEPKDWIQVEVTSRCNAACIYCPRTVWHGNWHNRTLSLERFEQLLPIIPKVELIHLQGWGEPLLNPHLVAMVAKAKAAGARVGTTTNGMLLDTSKAEDLVKSGLDILAFSLAGTSAASNDRIRMGTRLETVLEKLDLLASIKRRLGRVTPVVHVAYMLLASGMDELMALPALLRHHQVHEVVISLLDFVPGNPALAAEAISPESPAQRAELDRLFSHLKAAGRSAGLDIHTPDLVPAQRRETCTENVQHSFCVSAEGEVAPCPFAYLPVDQATFIVNGRELPFRRRVFGHIDRELLPAIWRDPTYEHWRAAHATGDVAPPCTACGKMARDQALPRLRQG